MILIVNPLGFYQGIILQCLTFFRDVVVTAYLAKRQYFELVAKNLSNLAEFIQIIGGKYYFHLFLFFDILDFYFHLIESLTIYTDNARL